jgi:chaperonin cofactor prefoldin
MNHSSTGENTLDELLRRLEFLEQRVRDLELQLQALRSEP